MRFEEQYQDVLQNLEYGVMEVYREHAELTDYDVMDAFAALRRHYIREVRQQEPAPANLMETRIVRNVRRDGVGASVVSITSFFASSPGPF